MNKEQIVRQLAEKMDINLVESRVYLNAVLEIIVEGLVADEKVAIHEFGRIFILSQSQRLARNPKTGEEVMLNPRKTIRLKPCDYLINKINNSQK